MSALHSEHFMMLQHGATTILCGHLRRVAVHVHDKRNTFCRWNRSSGLLKPALRMSSAVRVSSAFRILLPSYGFVLVCSDVNSAVKHVFTTHMNLSCWDASMV